MGHEEASFAGGEFENNLVISDPSRMQCHSSTGPGDSSTDKPKALKSATGTHQFHTVDIESVRGSSAKNQLAEAKGFLIRHPDGDKVSLTSLRAVGSGCEP
jgi:hypothetical protein